MLSPSSLMSIGTYQTVWSYKLLRINLGFSLYTILSIYYLVTILEVQIEFKRESSDKKKYIN